MTRAQQREVARAERYVDPAGIRGGIIGWDAKNRPVVNRGTVTYAVQRNGKHAPISLPWTSEPRR